MAKASIVGSQTEEIAVSLDREKISAYGIDPAGLFLEYQTATLSLPSGTFDTDYTSAPIHITGGVKQETEIADRIVYNDPSGSVIRLKDIAKRERRYRKPDSFVAQNGNACLVISVEMRPGNNIVAFGKEVDEVLDSYSRTLPDSVSITKITDQPKVVGKSVFSFLRDLIISMLIVILVMVILFPIRSALIASSGVPVCTAIALAVMYVLKIEINTVTLAALIVCLGMIVDDSIITIDGYMDKINKGFGKLEAACASAKELFMPTFIATAAICAMFYPMTGIIHGYLGDFVKVFPWVITIALMTSLFYAVSVVPSLEVKFIRLQNEIRKKSIIEKSQNWFFDAIQKIYEKCQAFCFRHPKGTLIGGLVAVVLGLLMFSRTNIQMMPMAARDFFVIEVETEGGYGIDRTKSYVDSLQTMLLADERVETVTSFIGTSAPRFTATYAPKLPSPAVAQMLVNTTSTKATESILKELENKREYIFPGAIVRYKQMDYNGAEAMIVITLEGKDRKALKDAAEAIKARMYSMDTELKWVHTDCDNTLSSIEIALRPDEAAKLGINKSLLSLSLAGTFNGQTVATLWEGSSQIPVNIFSEGISSDMEYSKVGDQLVATNIPGIAVPLRQVADIKPSWAPEVLDRLGGEESVSIFADMKYGKSQPASMKTLKNFIDNEIAPTLPEGTTIKYGGLSATNEDIFPEIAWSFFAAVMVLFLFLMFHFRKASLAILTLVMSLLCLFGAFFGLWVFDMDFTITAVLGLVSLVGIITRNGILMFEYAEEARFEHGLDVKTAAMEAGKRRMRPIFLTSCTTALGVLPMIISGDLLWMPMGIVICFGTMLSIFLVVLIMPISYWQLFRKAPVVKTDDENKE
ncbi:MAG: efflux RND transporter permease subunit [Bacteroidales bacterium]|nr:efflux RND transporter permease subunit [Bacteroidales bacterium]